MTRLINMRNGIIDGLLQSRIQPIIQKYNQPQQTGLLNFVNSPQAQDIASGLLAQSGYSTMPQSFGQSLGVAMQNANDRAMARDASELNAISTFANIQNLFKGQDQDDRKIDQTNRSLDQDDRRIDQTDTSLALEADRTKSTTDLQRKQGDQIDSNIEIDQQRINLDENKFDLQKDIFSFEKEEFEWEKENPEAKSEIGQLVQDFNNDIISQKQLDDGLKDILETDGTTTATIQNYEYVANQLFGGDKQKAILFLESSKGESKDDFVKTWVADAKNNPARPDDLGYLTAEANYAWNLSSAKRLPDDSNNAEKGTYYFNDDGVLALFDGTNFIPVTKPVPPQ